MKIIELLCFSQSHFLVISFTKVLHDRYTRLHISVTTIGIRNEILTKVYAIE